MECKRGASTGEAANLDAVLCRREGAKTTGTGGTLTAGCESGIWKCHLFQEWTHVQLSVAPSQIPKNSESRSSGNRFLHLVAFNRLWFKRRCSSLPAR